MQRMAESVQSLHSPMQTETPTPPRRGGRVRTLGEPQRIGPGRFVRLPSTIPFDLNPLGILISTMNVASLRRAVHGRSFTRPFLQTEATSRPLLASWILTPSLTALPLETARPLFTETARKSGPHAGVGQGDCTMQHQGKPVQNQKDPFSLLPDHMNDGLIIVQGGQIVYSNPRMAAMLDCTRDVVLSMPIGQPGHPGGEASGFFLQEAETGETDTGTTRAVRLQSACGDCKWVQVRSFAVEWENNPATLYLVQDVTRERELEERLLKLEEMCLSLFHSAPVGIFKSSLDGEILDINPAGAAMAGYGSPADMMRSVTNVGQVLYLRPEDRSELLEKVLSQPGWCSFQKRFTLRGRGSLWCHLTMRAVRSDDGSVRCLEGFIEDITPLKHAEESLQKACQHLEIQLAKRTADLQVRTHNLERITTALQVLLEKRQDERKQIEEAFWKTQGPCCCLTSGG